MTQDIGDNMLMIHMHPLLYLLKLNIFEKRKKHNI
jgi:hypothetical protein